MLQPRRRIAARSEFLMPGWLRACPPKARRRRVDDASSLVARVGGSIQNRGASRVHAALSRRLATSCGGASVAPMLPPRKTEINKVQTSTGIPPPLLQSPASPEMELSRIKTAETADAVLVLDQCIIRSTGVK